MPRTRGVSAAGPLPPPTAFRARRAPEVPAAQHAETAIVDCALYREGVRQGGRVPLEIALESTQKGGGGFVWIGLYEPDADALDAVAAEFGLHPLAVEDAVHAHQRPKLETYGETLFLVLKTVRYDESSEVVEAGEVMVFLGQQFVVTVRHGEASGLGELRRDLESHPELLALGPTAVLYAVADRVVDTYAPVLAALEGDIQEVEAEVFSDSREQPTQRLYKLKREVLELRRAILPLVEPVSRLAEGSVRGPVDARTEPYFRDVHDHALRAAEQVDGFDNLLTGALNANVAQVSLRQNEDMRKITAWVAILATNTLIAGIYGMNFDNMPELRWRYGYFLVLSVMAVVAVFMYRSFRRNSWL